MFFLPHSFTVLLRLPGDGNPAYFLRFKFFFATIQLPINYERVQLLFFYFSCELLLWIFSFFYNENNFLLFTQKFNPQFSTKTPQKFAVGIFYDIRKKITIASKPDTVLKKKMKKFFLSIFTVMKWKSENMLYLHVGLLVEL